MCLWKHFVPSTARLSLARLLQSKSQAHPNLTVKYVSTTVKREGFCSKHESNDIIKTLDTLAGISLYHHLSSSEFPDTTIQSITLYNVLAVSQVYFNLKVSSSVFFFSFVIWLLKETKLLCLYYFPQMITLPCF